MFSFHKKKVFFLYTYVKAQGAFLHHLFRFFLKKKKIYLSFLSSFLLETRLPHAVLLCGSRQKAAYPDKKGFAEAQPKASSSGTIFTAIFLYKKGRMASRCMIETSAFASLMAEKHKKEKNFIFNIQKLLVIQKNLCTKHGCDWPALTINLEKLEQCSVWIFNFACPEWQRNLKPTLCKIDLTDLEYKYTEILMCSQQYLGVRAGVLPLLLIPWLPPLLIFCTDRWMVSAVVKLIRPCSELSVNDAGSFALTIYTKNTWRKGRLDLEFLK